MTNVIIVDDEADARQLLQQYLAELPDFRVIGEAADGAAAARLINELRPDLVFLDVRMPGLNGFEVLTRLEELPLVIFSTAYDQYAIRAFEVHALDYLLKPYGRQRFRAAVARLNSGDKLQPLAETLLRQDAGRPHRVILQKGNRRLLRDAREITHVEAFGDYCKVHFPAEVLLANSGITELAGKLDPLRLLRVHRSYLVNMDRVSELKKEGRYWYLVVEGGAAVRVSESYLPEIRRLMI